MTADRVYVGGVVWPGPRFERPAEALALRDDRVLIVGKEEEVRAAASPGAELVRLEGRAVLPGFVDSHAHFVTGGSRLSSIRLGDVASRDDFARRVAAAADSRADGAWVTGGGWDHERWGGGLPAKEWIDPGTPENPVLLTRTDLHMALCNSAALRRAGVDRDTPDPEGGLIERSETGDPTGVLKDRAMELVRAVIPDPTEEERDRALAAASAHALSLGVTQVHDMGVWDGSHAWSGFETFRRARERGRLELRIYSVVPIASWERMRDFVHENGRGDERLWWGGVKGFVDGSLGSGTAWFHDPYDDEPDSVGLAVTDLDELRGSILAADAAGLQPIVHAIGDRANDWLLDVYEEIGRSRGPADRRCRIEHAQHLAPDAFGRIGEVEAIASMEPYHLIDDGRWTERRIGPERSRRSWAFASLAKHGARLAFGSDWTVAPLDPLTGVDAALTRRTLDGRHRGGWIPEERIGLSAVLRAYTFGGAFAAFKESETGALAPGMRADLVVLSGDPFAVPPEEVGTLTVDATVVDGVTVFRREDGVA